MIGETLSHFKITAKLGEGGMGEVYRAEDTKLGREVAIKVLPADFTRDPERLARFEREAKVLASFNHPSIAGIYEVGQQDGTHFLVMELAHGDTLAKRIELGPIPIEEALPLALQIAQGLEQAHEQGIVHRDLKPANIVVEAASNVKILDFGLAKAWAAPGEAGSELSEAPTLAAEMTQPGVVMGTAAYMSPEQANGEEADKRSDIWSFGVILEEMLSGHRMFQGPSLSATLAAVLRDPVTLEHLPAETPNAVKLLIARCLQRDRSKRLRDVGEARIGLESAIGAEVSSPLMAAVLGEAASEKQGRPRISWLVGGLGLLMAATAAMTIWSLIRPSEVAPPTSRLVISVPSEQQLRIGDSAYPMALSGDGQLLAYVAAVAGGEPSLFVRDLSSFDSRSIPGTEGAWYPFFSPSGDWLGFFANGQLMKVLVSGGPPQRICEAVPVRGASWSPDDFIYFSQSDDGGIHRVDAAGGAPERIRTGQAEFDENTHYFPHVLPDGSGLITFPRQREVRLNSGRTQLALLDFRTRQWRFLAEGTQAQYMDPGFLLIHVGRGEIRVVPFDLETHEIGTQPLPALDGVYRAPNFGGAFFAVSRNGGLVYLPGGFERNLRRVTREGRSSPLTSEVRGFRLPRISPNGRHLAVIVDPRPSELWVYDVETKTRSRLAHAGHTLVPVWSSDGRKITFTSNGNIYRVSANGSRLPEPIVERPGPKYAGSWSEDGRHLVFWDNSSGTADLWTLSEGALNPLLATPANEWGARLSPDGAWLAYQSDVSGRLEVYVQSFPDGSTKRTISATGGHSPVWAADGSELFYHDGESVFAVAIRQDTTLEAGPPKALFAWPHGLIHGFDVFPDGQSFVLIETDPDAAPDRFRVVLNWSRELEERFLAGTS